MYNMGIMLPSKMKILIALWILTIAAGIQSANAISCWSCVDDCEDPAIKQCSVSVNSRDNQCYMSFTPFNNEVVGMGCANEFTTDDEVISLIKDQALYLCDGNNCNGFSNIPKSNECIECDSPTDERCATLPTSQVNAKTRCNKLPYTECYERVSGTTGGITDRGCLNDLRDDEFYDCLTGANKLCRVCKGASCNIEVIPTNRLQCHRCDSTKQAGCSSSSPNALSICPIYNENDACVSRANKDGSIERGCRSEISCNGFSETDCKECTTNGCNTVELEPVEPVEPTDPEESIGDPGQFTGLPLNCYHCNGTTDCATNVPGRINVCYDNALQVCTTAFEVRTGQVIGRGCSDDLATTCASGSGNTCYQCKSNGCNVVQKESDLIDCLFCDGKTNNECALTPSGIERTRKCYQSCLTIAYVRNTTDVVPNYETMRTCLDDLDMDDQESCAAGTYPSCTSCNGAKCNTAIVLPTRKSCYHCSGSSCSTPVAKQCSAWTEDDQCFVEYDETGEVAEMGCRSKYDANELKLRITEQRLWLCDADNCNTVSNVPAAHTCRLCSSRTDPNCAIAPTGLTTTTCNKQPYTECYTRILSDGHTERGCLASLQSSEFYNCLYGLNGTQCAICSGDNCNQQVYPSTRRSCHVCSSDKSASCASTQPNAAQLCVLYDENDSCVTHLGDDGYTRRNCWSSLQCDTTDSGRCVACTADNCNTVNLLRNADANPGMWQSLPLTCHSCSGETQCSSSSTTNTAVCSGNDHCVTVFAANGNVAQRGCSSVVEQTQATYCDANADACYNCNSNRCNNASSRNDYTPCLYCDSRHNVDCASNTNAVQARRQCNGRCMTATFLRENTKDIYEVTRSCLDDKDEADQTACINSNGERCSACSGDSCNTALIPPNRLSCYHCDSTDSCEDPVKRGCSGWRENDQCFILFYNPNDVGRMGCLSDLTEFEVNVNRHQLLICSGDNCNSFSAIPTPKTCVSCHSSTDERCASRPQNVPTVSECTAVPYVDCFTRLNSDGSTQRGCVADLPRGDMLNCANGDEVDCTTCVGDRCNTDIFPADRLTCYRCNSDEDPTCASEPDAAEACPVYRKDQQCTAKIVEGVTYRGCSFDFTCDATNKQYCRMCDGHNCNVVDLASQQIGYPGKWQDPPINCYTCTAGECANGALGVPRKCEDNVMQNCGTVFASNGTVIERGCSDAIYSGVHGQYCDDNTGLCKFCKSSGCNEATSLNAYVDCIFCDGSDSRDCVFNPSAITSRRSCHQKCATAHYEWSAAKGTYIMARTCLDDLDLDDREACDSGNDATCQACTGSGCNTAIIPSTRLTCNRCSGNDCSSPRSEQCSAYRADDQCFTLFVEGVTVERMGCRSELEDSLVEERKRRLLLCNGNNCNTASNYPKPYACIVCNTRTEDKCATAPQQGSTRVACDDLPYTQCYTQLESSGHTKRGCLVDVLDPDFDDCLSGTNANCTVCTGNDCNTALIPTTRHSCNRCNSDDQPDCATNAAKYSEACPIFKDADQCVTMLSGEKTYRGCASDFSCDPNRPDTCRICAEGDNCNTINLLTASVGSPGTWQEPPLNCYHCDDVNECGSGKGLVRMCENNTLQTCMTVFNSNGAVEKRGCSDRVLLTHADYCDLHDDACYKCKSNGCNTATSQSSYIDCYFCNSVTNGASCSVAFSPNANTRTRKCQGKCMVALYPRSSSNPNTYELSRSCADDMDAEDAELCAQGLSPNCVSCSSGRCNTAALPNDDRQRLSCYKCVGDGCENPTTQECTAYKADDQCYIVFNHESSIVGMGCRSEYEEDVVQSLIRQKQMLICDGRNCNTLGSIPTPKSCSVCDSASDSRCATNPNLVGVYERCAAIPYTECFTRITASGHTQRGCLASLAADTFQGCLNGTDSLCETCSGNNCNEIDVYPANRLKCHQCHSVLDPLCTTAPDDNEVCPLYVRNDKCVTNLNNGETSRGCKSSMSCTDPDDRHTCRLCSGSGCNTANLELATETNQPGLWQGVPITCYSCSSVNGCANDLGRLLECEGDPYQQCVTVFNEANAVAFRGCRNSLTSTNVAYCNTNTGKCPACNSPGCNSATSLTDYIECWECDSYTNPECATAAAATVSTPRLCNKQCVTALYPRFDESQPSYGQVRSCLDDMDLDDREACAGGNKSHCVACTEARCNTVQLPTSLTRRSCYICEGDNCQSPQARSCPFYREDDQCYIRYDEQRSIVAMGCRSEFSNAEADYLLSQKRLFYCAGDNCNTFDALPSSQACSLCNSRTDPNCAVMPQSVLSTTTCSAMPYTQCYMRVLSDGATERGCLSNLYDAEFVSCLNGSSTSCESCTGSQCNNAVYPTGRRSCHICNSATDANCATKPNSLSICPWYAEDDSCVTAYISGETRRGCASELQCDPNNSRTCVPCDGDGCNTVNLSKKQDDNVGKWQDLPLTCRTCANGNCNTATTTERCENNNEQDCMTVFDGANVVRRGCSDTVEAEYDAYCDENADSCYKCKSNECNTATSIAEYNECVYCDTAKDQNCVWQPQSADLERRKCQGSCMTALYPSYMVEGSTLPTYETIRTCANDKEVADQAICASGNDTLCAACTGANCNTVNIPDNRHTCFICQGESCEDPQTLPCPLYRSEDQCFIWFDSTNSIGQMGCLSSFRNQDLEAVLKTKRVTICDGVNCNKPQSVSSAQKCVACNSADNKLCATNAQEVGTINTCSQLPYTECYSKLNSNGHTERGCLSDLSDDTFVNCLLGNDDNCSTCKGDVCNRDIYPADRLQCYACTSLDDANCESNPTRKSACPVVSATEGCLAALSGNTTIRGCSSEYYCDTTDGSTCRRCYGSECNAIDLKRDAHDDGVYGTFQSMPLRCHTCNGTQCLNSLGETLTCTGDKNQDCMTVFDVSTGNVLRRGCAHDVENYESRYCSQNPDACHYCKSNECNVAWSSSEYVKCIFCDSATDGTCVTNPANAALPERSCYMECMTTLKTDGHTLRTCLDDKELYDRQECRDDNGNDNKHCATCTSNRCNNIAMPADRLVCYACDSASTCASQAQASYCLKYEKDDFCFARYDEGRVAMMGCGSSQNASDLQQWQNENRLYSCDSAQCNDLSRLPAEGSCVACDSSKTPQCAQNPTQVTSFASCLAPYSTCITLIDSAGSTIRNCANTITQSDQDACVANGTCVRCDDANCNNEIFPVGRRRCHICNSAAEEECIENPNNVQVCPIYQANDRCVARNVDDVVERGCASSFTCDTSDGEHCKICDTDSCNTAYVGGGSAMIMASGMLFTILLALVTSNLF